MGSVLYTETGTDTILREGEQGTRAEAHQRRDVLSSSDYFSFPSETRSKVISSVGKFEVERDDMK